MIVTVANRTAARVSRAEVARIIERTFRILRRQGFGIEQGYAVSVAFVGQREAKAIASRFLKKRHAANVLSFDYGPAGELVLNPDAIRRSIPALGASFSEALRRLLIHGAVHLAGVHHERSRREARAAERLEADIERALRVRRR
ncbi:rRNA maturation RNase YbeY [Candidatus Parcubacteria bacterium]|nr:MAG: rRNA maturation RNase YbeY [Candidatus Parcubacteria bacterium]